jgi:DNA polymerase I-like protein with 3'-5' exonuclease and polymerase domains
LAFPTFYPYRAKEYEGICSTGCSIYQTKPNKTEIFVPSWFTKPENPSCRKIMIVLDMPIASSSFGYNSMKADYKNLTEISPEFKLVEVILRTLVDETVPLFITCGLKCPPHSEFIGQHKNYIFTSHKELERKKGAKALYDQEEPHFRYCMQHLVKEIEAYNPDIIVTCGQRVTGCFMEPKDVYTSRGQCKRITIAGRERLFLSTIGMREVALDNHMASQWKADFGRAIWEASNFEPRFGQIPDLENLHVLTSIDAYTQLVDYLEQSGVPFAFDTETKDLKKVDNKTFILSLSFDGINGYSVPIQSACLRDGKLTQLWNHPDEDKFIEQTLRLLNLPNEKIAFNLKFDLQAVSNIQSNPLWLPINAKWDVWMLAYIFEEHFSDKSWRDEKKPGLSQGMETKWGRLDGQVLTMLGIYDAQWSGEKDDRKDMAGAILKKGFMSVARYAGKDAIYTFRLWKMYQTIMPRAMNDELTRTVGMMMAKHVYTLTRVEQTGLHVDKEKIEWMMDVSNDGSIAREADNAKQEFLKLSTVQRFCQQEAKPAKVERKQNRQSMFGAPSTITLKAPEPFNFNSPKMLSKFFFDFLKIPTADGSRSTDKEFLAQYSDKYKEVEYLKIFRERAKLLQTYLPGFTDNASQYPDFRVRASYFLTTVTGRTSCEDPNLQQIPRSGEKTNSIKGLVKYVVNVRPGYALLQADYATAEVRVLALVSKDKDLADVFKTCDEYREKFLKEPSKELYYKLKTEADAHKQNAVKVYKKPIQEITKEERSNTKSVTFQVIFAYDPKYVLANNLGITTDAAQELVNGFLGSYKRVHRWFRDIEKEARETGYIKSLFGRRRALYGLWSRNRHDQGHALNTNRNSPIQGAASDWCLLAAYDFQKLTRDSGVDVRIVNLVHDAIYVECPIDLIPEWAPKLLRTMERPPSVAQMGVSFDVVPMSADLEIGLNMKVAATWDDTQEMMYNKLLPWLQSGASESELPKSIYE